ncbi:MAG: amidase family protein [Pseudomonadales bacterium]|nr:amidase family protein [Pseudomonadales bacterium]
MMIHSFNRRAFIRSLLYTGAGLATHTALPGCTLTGNIRHHQYQNLDATDISHLVRQQEVKPEDFVQLASQAIARLNPALNAVNTPFFKHADEIAKSVDTNKPFAGVPYLIKDLSDYKGFRTAYGSRSMLNNISQKNSVYVNAVTEQGFIPLGKTNTPEHGSLPTTEPLAFGPTLNPWNLEYSPGGSSGGSAVAVATGMVPIAHASDGGGSIRIPASNCGVFGLKVSRGRHIGSGQGDLSFSVRGAISRSVRDSVGHLYHTQRTDTRAPLPPINFIKHPLKRRLKIGLIVNGVEKIIPSDEVLTALDETVSLCQTLGHKVSTTAFPPSVIEMGNTMLIARANTLLNYYDSVAQRIGRPVDEREFEPWTLQQMAYCQTITKTQSTNAVRHIKKMTTDVLNMHQQFDLLLMPVLATRPVKLGYLQSSKQIDFEEMIDRNKSYVSYTTVFNIAGSPAMSVPLHWTHDEIPIGSQFAANVGQEAMLLGLAYELETAKPWKDKHPPISIWK